MRNRNLFIAIGIIILIILALSFVGKKEDVTVSVEGEEVEREGALFYNFDEAEYLKAVEEGKVVVLYFYAKWCPTCIQEFPYMEDYFKDAPEGIVGFRVNFNDGDTDEKEEALAQEFGVAYQHTKVVIKDGERVLKSPEQWSKNRYSEELNSLLQ